MLFTTHALVGEAIGVAAGNPILGFFGGIISHHIADWIPHFDGGSYYVGTAEQNNISHKWNRRDWTIVAIDLAIGLIASLIIWRRHGFSPALFWGGLGGVAPDLINVVPFWKDKLKLTFLGKKYADFHRWMHHTAPISRWYIGIGTNLVLIFVSLYYLLWR